MYWMRHQECGEKAWLLDQENQNDLEEESDDEMIPLGYTASPEGIDRFSIHQIR